MEVIKIAKDAAKRHKLDGIFWPKNGKKMLLIIPNFEIGNLKFSIHRKIMKIKEILGFLWNLRTRKWEWGECLNSGGIY